MFESQHMSIHKYRVRSTCLSCCNRIRGPAVAVVTMVREDNHETKARLVHESCQNAILLDLPFDNETKLDHGEEPTGA